MDQDTQGGSDRGVVDDGVVQYPCSDEFLIDLCVEFCRVRSHRVISTLRELAPADQKRRLGVLTHEIGRLLQHPQLFPSQSSRVRFLAFLAADSDYQLCEVIGSLLMQREIQTIHEKWQKNVSRKGYLDGTRGWENFLLFDAPGLPLASQQTVPRSMVQVMTPVAARIVGDLEREERDILRFVRENKPLLGRPAQMTTMVDFDNPTEDSEKVPDINLPQETKTALITPNPYAELRNPSLDILTTAAEDIEDYSAFIDRLETNPPNPHAPPAVLSNAHHFPALSVRSWQLPVRAKDLRYVK